MVTGIECPSRVHILSHAHTQIRPVLGKETKSSWIYYQVYCERQTYCKRLHPCFCLHGGPQLLFFFFPTQSHSVKRLVITGILCAASNREREVSSGKRAGAFQTILTSVVAVWLMDTWRLKFPHLCIHHHNTAKSTAPANYWSMTQHFICYREEKRREEKRREEKRSEAVITFTLLTL